MEGLYESQVICPVCGSEISVTKVKIRAIKPAERHSDFFVNYSGLNPMFYDVWVCSFCGYAGFSDKFNEMDDREANEIRTKITPRWNQREFNGERSLEKALEVYKLLLLNLQIRGAGSIELAKTCIRIAWLYRIKEDAGEQTYLKYALKFYTEAYNKERFPLDKLDIHTCKYLIAELLRRTGEVREASKWFSKLISSPEVRKNTKLMEMARDQFQLAKEQLISLDTGT